MRIAAAQWKSFAITTAEKKKFNRCNDDSDDNRGG